ncbi:hypothetical protein COOONC_10423, partial [Cooperia oncophora]
GEARSGTTSESSRKNKLSYQPFSQEAKQREEQLKNEMKLRQDQASPAASKIRELEEINDKMRLEFIAKASERHYCRLPLTYAGLIHIYFVMKHSKHILEKVISDLREEIDRIHAEHKESVAAEHSKLQDAQVCEKVLEKMHLCTAVLALV